MIKETLIEISKNFVKLSMSHHNIGLASQTILEVLQKGGKIMFCGNGGSAADSQHLAAELVGRYRINRKPISAVSLTTDTSSITAIANDFAFEDIFTRQIEAIGKRGDILYATSTSGKSKNVIKACKLAHELGIKVIGVTGNDDGEIKDYCDVVISVPSDRPDRIQEMHIAVGQIICEIIENTLFPK